MNVTPLIDVLLVLLIIFMAALPLTQQGLDVDIPTDTRRADRFEPSAQIVAEFDAARRLTINQRPVDINAARDAFAEVFRDRRDRTLYVIADASLRYGDVARVIDAAVGAGVESVGIITDSMRRGAGR